MRLVRFLEYPGLRVAFSGSEVGLEVDIVGPTNTTNNFHCINVDLLIITLSLIDFWPIAGGQ